MKMTFKKEERVKSRKLIDQIFAEGKTIKEFPFVLKYLTCELSNESNVQMGVSVPKKHVPKAVHRNKLKRQIREIYRKNKGGLELLFKDKDQGLALFLIYTGGEKEKFNFLEEKLGLILAELEKRNK